MLPSLCSDKIFISKYGDVGSVGVYFKEYNFSKILNAINLDAIVFASEGTVSQKYHDSSLPITEDLRLSRIKDATRVFEMYLNELEEKRSFIFKRDNDSDSHKEEFLDEFFLQEDNKFKDDYNDWENSVNFFKSGYNFSSIDAKKLGLVDEIGQKEDALNYIKDLVNLNKEFDYKFKIIDINFDDFKNLGNLVNYSDFNQSFSSSSLSDSSSSDSFSFDEGFNSGKDYNGIFSLVKSDEFLIKSAIQAYIKKYI
jgi:ClpP class serine protease